jgi:steroid delta-isomerase
MNLNDENRTVRLALIAYCEAFERLHSNTLQSELLPCLSDDVRFKDPFNDVRGKAAVQAVFAHMFATLNQPKFSVIHYALAGHVAYIHWQFDFYSRLKSGADDTAYRIQGVSQVTLNAQGLITQHLDFWDPAEHVYAHVPVLGWVLKKLAAQLAVPANFVADAKMVKATNKATNKAAGNEGVNKGVNKGANEGSNT